MGFDHFLVRLGHRIKAARVKCGLRQVDVEERIGLTFRHYQNIEAGRINISIETMYRLANLFKMKVDDLMPKDDSMA